MCLIPGTFISGIELPYYTFQEPALIFWSTPSIFFILAPRVCSSSRKFCCLIGIRAVAECLAKSNSEETQDCARNLLQQLSSVSYSFLLLHTIFKEIRMVHVSLI